jgi:phosphoglycolate phosphatase-like HAD superfamily hydrolase
MKIVLFDIDGTLLLSDGAGRRAIHAALQDTFGAVGPEDLWFDGKTDIQIVRELMRSVGHSDAAIDERMSVVLERYLVHLDRELRRPDHFPKVFPGAVELLDALRERTDVLVGLLTGNVHRGATAKLERVGLDPARFAVGAFGSDHERRSELPCIAQRRARELLGRDVAGSSMVVIGDTPSDVTCGAGIGARAIGVATGRYSHEELAAHGPAAAFADLTATSEIIEVILRD